MSEKLTRARIVPFDDKGTTPQDDKAVRFDFNPETLTLKVSSGQQQDKARRGRGQVQSVGASSATLSFDAIFDTTRPRAADDVRSEDRNADDALDVRKRTKPIADLLANAVPGSDAKAKEKAPRRVRFQWGTVIFDGIITSYQETFDFFSPTGTPLRSKIQVTLSEQNFAYSVSGDELARQAAAAPPASLRDAAEAAGQDGLFGTGGGIGFSLDASLSLDAGISAEFSASASFEASLGLKADLGVSLNAGIALDASAAISVFGANAVVSASGIGGGDAGQAGLKLPPGAAATGKPAPGALPPPSPWAPDGPAAGSAAAGIAAGIVAARRGFGADPAGGPPIALLGSPPPVLPRVPASGLPVFGERAIPEARGGERRPSWEGDGNAARAPAAPIAAHSSHQGGCGCRSCCGGRH